MGGVRSWKDLKAKDEDFIITALLGLEAVDEQAQVNETCCKLRHGQQGFDYLKFIEERMEVV